MANSVGVPAHAARKATKPSLMSAFVIEPSADGCGLPVTGPAVTSSVGVQVEGVGAADRNCGHR
jgi:hypothetical protein